MFQKKIILILFVFVLCLLFLGSCSNRNIPATLPGKWESNGHIYEYTSYGTLYYNHEKMHYEILDDSKIRIVRNQKGINRSMVFPYHMNEDGTFSMNGITYFPLK